MTENAVNPGGDTHDSHWVRRTAAVTFCLLLIGTLGAVFTRVIAARVPEQRATLEKLITDRTGLAVRFDNVHFAWNLDGTSAVFTRVELTDPQHGRVRVVAPELRVKFDTWDFLRHQQFSLGHVTLSAPDIEITGDPEEPAAVTTGKLPPGGQRAGAARDEAALVRRFTAWAELMPNGRIEVEGARVHLLRRGSSRGAARRSFTLSQAVVSRGAGRFNAYGTMLLAQDVGQSLFVSAQLEGLGPQPRVSGELRVIARRVFLEQLALPGMSGRATLDAKLRLRDGRVESGSWQASARDLELAGDDGVRFDHLSVNGKLSRDAHDLLLDFTDLQLTRGARLERAPSLAARLRLEPGSVRIARTTVSAERVPFMAAEFIAGLLAPQLAAARPGVSAGWVPVAGELHALRFDSGERRTAAARRRGAGLSEDGWVFDAQVERADLERASDQVRLAGLEARVHFDAHELALTFDPASAMSLRMRPAQEPRALNLGGRVVFAAASRSLRFDEFSARSGASSLVARGAWEADVARPQPLGLDVTNLDRALTADMWTLLAPGAEAPALLAGIEAGTVLAGAVELLPGRDASGALTVNWPRSTGKLELAGLVVAAREMPRLAAGRGALTFSRGNVSLRLDAGQLDDMVLTGARLDWPRAGAPRLHAALAGQLDSALLRRALRDQGLERLSGAVTLEADARGERELRQPDLWRVTARVSDASVPLAGGLPPIEKLSGTIRYSNAQLRAVALAGSWLGGSIDIETRRPALRGGLSLGAKGVADSGPLLRLLGQGEAASRVNGPLAWTGTVQRLAGIDAWQVALASDLAGVESHMPAPFDKTRARALPVSAELRFDAAGIRDFQVDGRDLQVRGQVREGVTAAHFDVQGVSGELRRAAAAAAQPEIGIDRLDLKRAAAVLAAAGVVMPSNGVAINIGDVRYAERSLGALQTSIARAESGVEFALQSPGSEQHQLAARGRCDASRCSLEFTADTAHLGALLRGVQLPPEWPVESLHAAGEISWPVSAEGDLTRSLAGRFDIETAGADSNHQLMANATLADGLIQLANVQGTGPAPDQVFRGSGRVGLMARSYDLTVDYEQVSLAATAAVPTPARARLTRAWSALRGSVARRGWTEPPESRRVQWHGTWD